MFSSSAVVTGGTFIQQNHHIDNHHVHARGGFERLCEAAVPAAFHDRLDGLNCHPNTYTAVFKRIMDWVLGLDDEVEEDRAFMMWLSGAAGADTKSSIALTVAELCQQNGALLASFSFSDLDPSRNHAGSLVATISYQIAVNLPRAKEFIVAAIERDPLILSKSLETQFSRLIFKPLNSAFTRTNNPGSSIPHLIVIDSLDECGGESIRLRILCLLLRARRDGSLPPQIQFLFTSRLESEIATAINNSQPLAPAPIHLVISYSYHRDDDIGRFLRKNLQEIKDNHPNRACIPPEWPSNRAVEDLIRKSSGQFIYATTLIKYVSSVAHHPPTRLELVLGLRATQFDSPYADLDALYTHIFSTVDDINTVLRILGLAILETYPSTELIEGILGLESGAVKFLLEGIGSLVSVIGADQALRVEFFHQTLTDFLLDELRSKDLHLNLALRHAEYTHLCFQHVFKPSTDSITPLILQSLIRHLKMCPPSAQLHQDIINFPDMQLAQVFRAESFLWIFWPSFLSIIRASQWEDAEELYEIQEQRFEKLMRA